MAETDNTNNTDNETQPSSQPSFLNGVKEAAAATAKSVTDYANKLTENSKQEIINAAETEKVILEIKTDKFATALDSYNELVANFPESDPNLNSFDNAANSVKIELSTLTGQINDALAAHLVAKRKEIESNIKTGGRRVSKKRSNKKNKRGKSNKHKR